MRNRSVRWQRGLTVVGVVALSATLVGVGASTASANPNARTAFPGSVPSFVTSASDAGATAADTTVEGEVYLNLKDEVGAQAFATAVSTPGNKKYGQFLSPSAWIKTYAPSKSALKSVENYLTGQGMTITGVPTSREYVVFRGPAAAVASAFSTSMHSYKFQGTTVTGPSTAPALPNAIASAVTGINLGNARSKLTRPDSIVQGQGIPGAKANAKSTKVKGSGATSQGVAKPQTKSNQATTNACSTYYGENTASMPEAYGSTKFPTFICGYLPSQLRSSADLDRSINSGYDGSGVTIGIVDAYASPTILQDTNTYMMAAGEPLLTRFKQIGAQPSDFTDEDLCGGPANWQGEETLDVQSAHSVAPGAKILYSGGANCGGMMDIALSAIIDHGKADLVSNSYGYTGEAVGSDVIRGQQNIHIQAAGTGIGLYYSSGDDGDDSVDFNGTPAVNWPATSPFVTAVGGTSLAIGANGAYQSEVGWGDILDKVVNGAYTAALPGDLYGGGGGGGTSTVIAQPAYQKGVVPTALAGKGANASRVIPDVSDLADPYTGFQIAISPILDNSTLQTGPLEYVTYGGTSLASPLVAGKMAVTQQLTGHRIGFANPSLYQQARQSKAFHDVKAPGSTVALSYTSVAGNTYLNTLAQGLSLNATKGYDDFTGLGSLKVPGLAKLLAKSAHR